MELIKNPGPASGVLAGWPVGDVRFSRPVLVGLSVLRGAVTMGESGTNGALVDCVQQGRAEIPWQSSASGEPVKPIERQWSVICRAASRQFQGVDAPEHVQCL